MNSSEVQCETRKWGVQDRGLIFSENKMKICQTQNSHSDLFHSKANFFQITARNGGNGKEAAEEACGLGDGGGRERKIEMQRKRGWQMGIQREREREREH